MSVFSESLKRENNSTLEEKPLNPLEWDGVLLLQAD